MKLFRKRVHLYPLWTCFWCVVSFRILISKFIKVINHRFSMMKRSIWYSWPQSFIIKLPASQKLKNLHRSINSNFKLFSKMFSCMLSILLSYNHLASLQITLKRTPHVLCIFSIQMQIITSLVWIYNSPHWSSRSCVPWAEGLDYS